MTTKITIVNRNAAVAHAMALLLGQKEEFDVVAELTEADKIMGAVADAKPQLLLVDPALPNLDLDALVGEVAEISPQTAVAVLTDSSDSRYLKGAVESGAQAYLSMEGAADELMQKLKLIAGGHVIASGSAASALSDLAGTVSEGSKDGLSDREVEVVNLVARGDTNKEIADTLVIAENTVKVHLRNIYGKLSLRNRQELTAYALQPESESTASFR
jgi:DNA-binding NarL/FixJ family response regulator